MSKCVLLIEDNEDCAILLEFVFECNADWQLLIASSGREGIALAKSEQPDVILLDVVMPKLDGLDVYKLLKSNLLIRQIPIIFATAMSPIGEIRELQITEDVEVITKPFDILRLLDYLNEACDDSKVSC